MKIMRMFKTVKQGSYSIAVLLLFFVYTMTTSCVNTKNLLYFKDIPDTMSTPVIMTNVTPYTDPVIQSNDNLAITVQTVVQNQGNSPITSTSTGTFNPLNGFLVDKNGYVELSLIGFVKVAGLTTMEARELIKQKAKEFYKDPVVNVRIANFDVKVYGDVARPGVVNISSEKASVMDALAMAGDMNITAKRNNLLLIRTEGNEKKFVRFDMRSANIYQSPYLWLRQRDEIIVEPNKFKLQSTDQTFLRNLGIISTLISTVSLVLLFRNIK